MPQSEDSPTDTQLEAALELEPEPGPKLQQPQQPQQPPQPPYHPPRRTLDLRLRDDVARIATLGMVFDQPHRLVSEIMPELKSYGTRYFGSKLAFEPDGTVTGKFLKLVAHAWHAKGPRPAAETVVGDRSCWRALYEVFPGGSVVIFHCTDCDHDLSYEACGIMDVCFGDTSFDDDWLLAFLGTRHPGFLSGVHSDRPNM